ncbi:MAG: hypothetical protein H6598_03155 [Flavobacteriales bacterium]|nr:hypothetical protein [Flavobacteriales bacterium]
MRLIFLVFIFIIATSCKKGKKNSNSCNGSSTRRDVKICVDDAKNEIDTMAILITVDSIGSIEVPEVDKEFKRQEIEKKVFSITATVHKVSKHRDGDLKIKLTNGNEKYINCELPNMGCTYISDSRFYNEMSEARNWAETHWDELEGKTVTIIGVAFIDIDHKYPRNAADNELELHPILDIHF